jgi:hypothetical protein
VQDYFENTVAYFCSCNRALLRRYTIDLIVGFIRVWRGVENVIEADKEDDLFTSD